jgi:hypothetical protein
MSIEKPLNWTVTLIAILSGALALVQAHDARVSAQTSATLRLDQQEAWIRQLSTEQNTLKLDVAQLQQRVSDEDGH